VARRRAWTAYVIGVTILAALAVVVVRAVWDTATSHLHAEDCTIGGYVLDPAQAEVAASMVAAQTRFQPALPDRAAVLALAAGLQESKLRNLPPGAGDRDSVGVLQQRPSQGWGGGDVTKLENVGTATTEFLQHLIKIDGWQTLPLAVAIQDVQVSADGSAYAQYESEALALTNALRGRVAQAVTCEFPVPTVAAQPATVAARLQAELPVNPPSTDHGRITIPGAGWQTVAWLISYADRLGIDAVGYDGRTWVRAHGWRTSSAAADSVVATMAIPPGGAHQVGN
jgi:hypothetical protein